ncbi:uncharacterized protein BX663DRAFT_529133 [Cokeromyces recurvatus]|uniref:uncharacterized protein n=1 Tax=Cokeromyces recurvatus TaxID=90255 RepID=UPI00221F8F04|nr:uncharacterized protein BX663DRAFT_529133 [Cokeromyces recurvatus]KAI7906349.1 hypothetical protein BX663DRAFT_529133 [Cokeromyces recurvatus]
MDDRNMYKADGVIRIDILFLETSHHFVSTDQRKSKIDHHKGLFGALAMLKTNIGDKLEAIPRLSPLLKETSRLIMELKKEHDSTLMKNMFKSSSCLSSLSLIVNPSILHLTEEEDKIGMAHLGPLFFPKQ